MATLDKVMQMQGQGISDAEISNRLRNEGISPKEIVDAMNQARIKTAVSSPQGVPPAPSPAPSFQEMQPSIGSAPTPPATMPAPPAPAAQQAPAMAPPAPESYPPEQNYQSQYQEAPQEDYYQPMPNAYQDQGYYDDYYGQQGTVDTETITEIAEQVTTEKFNEFRRQTGDLIAFRNAVQDKIADIDGRLKRIENAIEHLQSAVIGKVGEFGESSALIHKDLENLHGTMSKMMDPLMDSYNELKKLSEKN